MRARIALFSAAILAGPGLLLWHLHPQWNPDGAYAYGWVVPWLAVFLFKYRWDDRPAPSAPLVSPASWAVFLALVSLPARWLQEAAPERGLSTWSYATACVGISLCLIALAGGVSWLQWFSFPVAFVLTAVPWPHSLEVLVSNNLMHGTAAATVEILCMIGVPAAQAGNLVHIETGVIDIDEACSGIRSLQAMVMVSLFLGELFRLTGRRRLWLLVMGLGVTLLANVVRTVILSHIGFGQGMPAVDRYHDGAGLAVLIFSLSSTLLIAFLLRPKERLDPVSGQVSVQWGIPFRLSAALLLWWGVEELAVEAWYRGHETKWEGWSWSVQWPEQSAAFRKLEIPKRSLHLLMCDEANAATWREPDGHKWAGYALRWNPGNPAAEVAKVHRPDVCLNAEGAIMERDLGVKLCPVGGTDIPFHAYVFRMDEKPLYVFFCLYEEVPLGEGGGSSPTFEGADMVERARKGRRHIGLQSLELALAGYPSDQSAREAFDARLGEMMHFRLKVLTGRSRN